MQKNIAYGKLAAKLFSVGIYGSVVLSHEIRILSTYMWCHNKLKHFASWGILHAYLSSGNLVSKLTVSKNILRNTLRFPNSLDSGHAGHFVGPDLGSKLFAVYYYSPSPTLNFEKLRFQIASACISFCFSVCLSFCISIFRERNTFFFWNYNLWTLKLYNGPCQIFISA